MRGERRGGLRVLMLLARVCVCLCVDVRDVDGDQSACVRGTERCARAWAQQDVGRDHGGALGALYFRRAEHTSRGKPKRLVDGGGLWYSSARGPGDAMRRATRLTRGPGRQISLGGENERHDTTRDCELWAVYAARKAYYYV